ncbi:hypothetical protein RND81_02G187800 [Saponaria officinalis]|uniref:Retrotransposon gag domain-containing protein n=1 Tax=Saponaria officinalis TaxID=3572 RepID=A0AAW1MVX6_SAPOF
MELALSAKRKLGYVTGKIAKPKEDEEKIEAWVVSNNQVITWILQNVSERIKMLIIYTPTAKGIWDTLEKRYTVSNGARKFKLNKESYEITQNGRPVEEYFTQLQMVWDELNNMNSLPTITKISTEMAEYLTAVEEQAEERRLFQFLNGLDKQYGMMRRVDHIVSLLLQEEVQINNIGGARVQESSALMGKGETERVRCVHCGRDNHRSDMCWEIKGYPVGHPKHKKSGFKPGLKGGQGYGFKPQRTFQSNSKTTGYKRTAANAQTDLSAAIGAATLQLENLLKLVPNSKTGGETDEELECNFAGMSKKNPNNSYEGRWIIDSGIKSHDCSCE